MKTMRNSFSRIYSNSEDFQVSVFQDNKLSGLDEGGENDVVV